MPARSRSPKLMVSGSRAEQPRPASAKMAMPATASPRGSTATSTKVTTSTNGRTWYVTRSGSHRPIAANRTRPTVTIPQNRASANEACVAEAPTRLVRSSWDQLPFIVSQIPYSTANPAKTQNRPGSPDPARRAASPARSGSRALNASTAASSTVERIGRPHQKPRPTKMATRTGATAVPSPSSAFSTSTARSTPSGWNTEA